jgi:hypothetical protein
MQINVIIPAQNQTPQLQVVFDPAGAAQGTFLGFVWVSR